MNEMVKNTSAQRKAANTKASVWVSASAGTGKTKVLTDRILNLLLDGTPPERILALTFTKAAAGEMAGRLARTLGAWATLPTAELTAAINNIAPNSADAARRQVARQLFARVLDVPGGMRIQTIHAFCEALLKRFPLEANVIPHFAVMDERDAAELLAECRADVIRAAQAQADGPLARALAVIGEHQNEDQFTDVLGAIVGERARIATLLQTHDGLEGLIGAVYRTFDLAADDTRASIIGASREDPAFNKSGLRKTAEAMLTGSATDQKRGQVVLDWLAADEEPAGIFDAYVEVFFTTSGKRPPRKTLINKKAAEAAPHGERVLCKETSRLNRVQNRLKALATADATAALLTLGEAVLRAYEDGKRHRAALDYDDLILKARNLLRPPGTTWVHYKLDGGIEHVLVDEAQDTNPEQWQVIDALTNEFFAGEGTRGIALEELRTILAVGDEKQSIYSFQRADPEGFLGEKDKYQEQVLASGGLFEPVDLDRSFRTTSAVLKIVDDVFNTTAAGSGLFLEDRKLKHAVHKTGLAGRVEVWPAAVPTAKTVRDAWELPVKPSSAQSPQQRVAGRIADTIATWLLTGEILESEGRPVRAGDILVLLPRRSPFFGELVRALKSCGVPVAGMDRMVLTDQIAVMDLVALGRFLLLPEDDLNLAALLKSPLCGLDDNDLMAIALGREGSVWRALRERGPSLPNAAPVLEMLEDLLGAADFERPYDLFARVLAAPGYDGRKRILTRLGPDAEDPVDEFLSLALAYEQGHIPSLEGFLHWLEAGDAEIKRDLEQGDRNQVRIMTVHGAKGLEAPIVFMPDTFQQPVNSNTRAALLWHPQPGGNQEPDLLLWPPRSALEDQKCRDARAAAEARDRAEHWRKLYVAMTRAAERLYVCGWLTRNDRIQDDGWLKPERAENTWYQVIAQTVAAKDRKVPFDATGEWASPWGDGAMRFETVQEVDAKPEDAVKARDPAPLPDWATNPPKPEADPPRPLAPSRPERADPAVRSPLHPGDDEERPVSEVPPVPDDPFRRGTLIHRMLELLPGVVPEMREEAAAKFLARAASDIDAPTRAAWIAETLAVLDAPEFAEAFGPNSLAEVPVTGIAGGRVISGQIDRLMVGDERVLVVDYKTNRPPPARPEDVSPVYLQQMAAYRALLARIYEGRRIDCALLWTDTPHLMPLEGAALDRHAP